ncbi:PIG-L family deacetylase [Streptomyces sp. NPDC059460]|uniref:PIG-L family deacetylase n=1 Tax=Streptomyces sp. NPDC059460 TaxID=3346840 RepID=UPI0036A59139
MIGVAHPDDDLYFVDPEIRKTIRAGCAVTTVYLTAGDDGKSPQAARDYVARRENGVRAAYAELAGAPDRWTEDSTRVNGRNIRSFSLGSGSPSPVKLFFLGLHDGLPHGQESESMLKLFLATRKRIQLFQSVESYTEDQLLQTLSDLARQERAQRILTLDYDNASFAFGLRGKVDHSDHGIGARYFRKAGYLSGVPVESYLGYTMSSLEPNLPPEQVAEKEAAVRRYIARADCHSKNGCATADTYRGPLQLDDSDWVHRQYRQEHRNPRLGEIMGDVGRTTEFSSRDPEQCLEAVSTQPKYGAVRINTCNGTSAQKWEIRDAGTIRTRLHRGFCLTKLTSGAGLAPCNASRPEQKWAHKPWKSTTWKRTAWRIVGEKGMCLYQDDRSLPPYWNSRTAQHPRLGLVSCNKQPEPELYWRWAAGTAHNDPNIA